MDNIDSIIEQAEEHCKNHHVRLTVKRKRILSALLKSSKALSAYELIDVCEAQYGEKMSATSVYRILECLETEQLVHKLNLVKKYIACSHISCNSNHSASQFLICHKCNKVEEIHLDSAILANLQENVQRADFELVSPQLEISCLCDSCKT